MRTALINRALAAFAVLHLTVSAVMAWEGVLSYAFAHGVLYLTCALLAAIDPSKP